MMILVFGKNGQVGTELGQYKNVQLIDRGDVNLTDPLSCKNFILKSSPKCVINAAGYNFVDQAEYEKDLANVVNGHSPGFMAMACRQLQIPFIHLSSDYVFNGEGFAPWKPADKTDPINAYGYSKLMGEEAVKANAGRYVILRTSWVFSGQRSNFVSKVLQHCGDGEEIRVVNDQVGGPTPASELAKACISIAEQMEHSEKGSGVFHFSGKPEVSRYEFAQAILQAAGEQKTVSQISTSAGTYVARRPLNSVMDCSSLKKTYGILQPDWRASLEKVIRRLKLSL